MILGIPAYTVMRVLAREFFYNFKAVQKITSSLSPENMNGRNTNLFRKEEEKSDETES